MEFRLELNCSCRPRTMVGGEPLWTQRTFDLVGLSLVSPAEHKCFGSPCMARSVQSITLVWPTFNFLMLRTNQTRP